MLLKPEESFGSGFATAKTDSFDLESAETQSPGIDNVIPFSEYSTDCYEAFTSSL